MDVSEAIVAYDIKADFCSQLNLITFINTKGQGHLLTLVLGPSYSVVCCIFLSSSFDAKIMILHRYITCYRTSVETF